MPTLEGYDGNFTGVSAYSTLDLPRGLYLDLVPHFDRNLDYSGTDFTLHKDVKRVSLGASSNTDLEDINLRFGKFWKGCNITGSLNPKTKTGELSYQKNFD